MGNYLHDAFQAKNVTIFRKLVGRLKQANQLRTGKNIAGKLSAMQCRLRLILF